MQTAEPLIRELDIEAAPETVFEFFVDPAKLTRWLAAEATLDPRPGGVCHLVQTGAGPDHPQYYVEGEFLEVDAPKRVVFTWGFSNPDAGVRPGGSTVQVTLSPIDTGTRVRLVTAACRLTPSRTTPAAGTTMLARLVEAVRGA